MTTDVEKQEGQKTVVSFAAGLLIGGLLVWAFSGSSESEGSRTIETENNDDSAMEASEDESESTDTSDNEERPDESATETTPETAVEMEVGEASVDIGTPAAGNVLALEGATFPTAEGWVGVRLYTNETMGSILGVARYSEEQGLIPTEIELLSPLVAGRDYAVVFFAENGDRDFNPALDAQLDTDVTAFTAR